MKKLLLALGLMLCCAMSFAQNTCESVVHSLYTLTIGKEISLHIISPEAIRYADISSGGIIGDLPEGNVLRLKMLSDSARSLYGKTVVLTIVTERHYAQVLLSYSPDELATTAYEIQSKELKPLDISAVSLSSLELKAHAMDMLKIRKTPAIRMAKSAGITSKLKSVRTVGSLIFLDLSLENHSNLPFDIDHISFSLRDKKINNATNVQQIALKPVFSLYKKDSFVKSYRNVFAFEKISFPGSKALNIEFAEKQISGRRLDLKVSYKDILNADTF